MGFVIIVVLNISTYGLLIPLPSESRPGPETQCLLLCSSDPSVQPQIQDRVCSILDQDPLIPNSQLNPYPTAVP